LFPGFYRVKRGGGNECFTVPVNHESGSRAQKWAPKSPILQVRPINSKTSFEALYLHERLRGSSGGVNEGDRRKKGDRVGGGREKHLEQKKS